MNYRYKCRNQNIEFNKIKELKKTKDISIILPTYNEEDGIRNIIKAIANVLKNKNYEIMIVDDNSKDKTPEIIDSYNSDNIAALHRQNKRGLLSAITDGVKMARSDIIVMMDADFSHPPSKILEMFKYIKGYDVVTCSRFRNDGGAEAPLIKKYTSKIFNLVIRLIFFGTGLTDFTSGFHMIRRNKFLDLNFIYPALWGEFDIELLYTAKRNGYKIKEISYVYKYRTKGTSKAENYLKNAYIYWKTAIKVRLFK